MTGSPRKVLYSSFADNTEVCSVAVLHLYIQRTAKQVMSVSHPKPLFIISQKPFYRARPGTIGHWIKNILCLAGIDTEIFSAYSTRSASTSWATARGVPVSDILKASHWSSSSTFEQFYYRLSSFVIYPRIILQSTNEERY